MTEKIDWQQELLTSAKFNRKQKNLLKDGKKSFTHNWSIGVLYTRWKKLQGIREQHSPDNSSSFQEWNKRIEYADKCQY